MFSAKSKGLIRTHFTQTSFQLDKIECEWLFRHKDANSQSTLGMFPDGTTVLVTEFENAVMIAFPPKESYPNPEGLRYLYKHRKLIAPPQE